MWREASIASRGLTTLTLSERRRSDTLGRPPRVLWNVAQHLLGVVPHPIRSSRLARTRLRRFLLMRNIARCPKMGSSVSSFVQMDRCRTTDRFQRRSPLESAGRVAAIQNTGNRLLFGQTRPTYYSHTNLWPNQARFDCAPELAGKVAARDRCREPALSAGKKRQENLAWEARLKVALDQAFGTPLAPDLCKVSPILFGGTPTFPRGRRGAAHRRTPV